MSGYRISRTSLFSALSAKLLNHLINISKSKTSACCCVGLLYAIWQMDHLISMLNIGLLGVLCFCSFFSYVDRFSGLLDFLCRLIFIVLYFQVRYFYFRNSTTVQKN